MTRALLPVAAFQETLDALACAPATLKMLLTYWNLPGSEKGDVELAAECGTDLALGTTNEQFMETAARYGLVCEAKANAEFADMEFWLDRNIPVVVDWFSPGRKDAHPAEMPDGHYSTVVGLDEDQKHTKVGPCRPGECLTLKHIENLEHRLQNLPIRETSYSPTNPKDYRLNVSSISRD